MSNIRKLEKLIDRFSVNLDSYKDPHGNYNETETRNEFIDPLLKILGWDVANNQGLPPQYKEVLVENIQKINRNSRKDRPDYSLTLKGVVKFFVEAKKPSVDIIKETSPAFQIRRYGWNANHKISVLTNFEYLCIYDVCYAPQEHDSAKVALFKKYHFREYVDKFEEISKYISRDSVYSGTFDECFSDNSFVKNRSTQKVDTCFLEQINNWRLAVSRCLYKKSNTYKDVDVLNDCVQSFINQIVFLRICEDRNLPTYHKLCDATDDMGYIVKLIRESDKQYNSGLFKDDSVYYELDESLIKDIVKGLYYPHSPYLFNIIESNILGKVYEEFLTKKLFLIGRGLSLLSKKEYVDRSVVSTPQEIVKYIVEKTLAPLCKGKTPKQILDLKIADIACGSGVFLVEAFDFLVKYCEQWYEDNNPEHLLELIPGKKHLSLWDKREILTTCIYGIDIDAHAVEVAKFSLLIKLLEDETAPSVQRFRPILPCLDNNIVCGNALVESEKFDSKGVAEEDLLLISPFSWSELNNGNNFSAIVGNPPYVKTEDMRNMLADEEFDYYLSSYKTPNTQFDKYFLFIEQALNKIVDGGRIGFIVPNKFYKTAAGKKLQLLLANNLYVESIDDFGSSQLFEDKTTYSCILCLSKKKNETFSYAKVSSLSDLWGDFKVKRMPLPAKNLQHTPWILTDDINFEKKLKKIKKYSKPLGKYASVFNGIQTSAERKKTYWFSQRDIVDENETLIFVRRGERDYKIEKEILRPYFKPTNGIQKGLTTYDDVDTDKRIIFPYDEHGKVLSLSTMKKKYPNTLEYLKANYAELEPKQLNKRAKRDVPGAEMDSWYQYGRNQGLTSFINTPKLIVAVMRKAGSTMYAYDDRDVLIASGGTAGYCAISKKCKSPYSLLYIQAWLENPNTEKYIETVGSPFEGGFIARGTAVLSKIPFVPLDLQNKEQKKIYDTIVSKSKRIIEINDFLRKKKDKKSNEIFSREKKKLIKEIEQETNKIWNLEFL